MKFQVKATADTSYQLQSLRQFGMPVKSHMDGSHSASQEFDTEEEAIEYLIKRAEMYFEDEKQLEEAIEAIKKYGYVRLDASTGRVEEVEEVFYFAVYDKEDTYSDGECLMNFNTEDEAREFVLSENAGYGYEKLYYKLEEGTN